MPWLRSRLQHWLQIPPSPPATEGHLQVLQDRMDSLEHLLMTAQHDDPEGPVRDSKDPKHRGHWPDAHLGAQ